MLGLLPERHTPALHGSQQVILHAVPFAEFSLSPSVCVSPVLASSVLKKNYAARIALCAVTQLNCSRAHRLQPARLVCPCDFPGKNTGVRCHFLLQGSSDPGIRPTSLVSPALAGRSFTTSATWEAQPEFLPCYIWVLFFFSSVHHGSHQAL